MKQKRSKMSSRFDHYSSKAPEGLLHDVKAEMERRHLSVGRPHLRENRVELKRVATIAVAAQRLRHREVRQGWNVARAATAAGSVFPPGASGFRLHHLPFRLRLVCHERGRGGRRFLPWRDTS